MGLISRVSSRTYSFYKLYQKMDPKLHHRNFIQKVIQSTESNKFLTNFYDHLLLKTTDQAQHFVSESTKKCFKDDQIVKAKFERKRRQKCVKMVRKLKMLENRYRNRLMKGK